MISTARKPAKKLGMIALYLDNLLTFFNKHSDVMGCVRFYNEISNIIQTGVIPLRRLVHDVSIDDADSIVDPETGFRFTSVRLNVLKDNIDYVLNFLLDMKKEMRSMLDGVHVEPKRSFFAFLKRKFMKGYVENLSGVNVVADPGEFSFRDHQERYFIALNYVSKLHLFFSYGRLEIFGR